MELAIGDVVFHPGNGELALVVGSDPDYLHLRFGGSKDVRKFKKGWPATQKIRKATEEESLRAKISSRLSSYEHSDLIKTYLEWLRDAGSRGVDNMCGCAKDSYWNYTCKCKTLVKLYHRFSVFKDILVNELGYDIVDVESEGGRHKTILQGEPVKMISKAVN